ncbi:YbaB/EbfC family nucleoid-associated protein [Amycolatopsis cynarae]|uniref:YbaB/EbfC family nucleoid-associated protein n=1 Tax=Amycolatopsis cynarae TaxID=2995223 RepID=A0ABY7BDR4_9PSEU|nr:YbaB/EbfC family nucleoid-associated protein [Amycolatopsis sp. HUAS 11-8]WAL69283.1 YbaB/EbfC family nucleoid-associated protein [Amycolatopsis sp. HUAS 11-8]
MTAGGLDGLMRDPEQAAASIDAWAEGLAAKADRYRAAQERTEEIRLSSANSDGSVRVTVRADGSITDLVLTGRARSMPLDELSAQILTTMRRAQARIADRVGEVLTEEIGDEDPQTHAMMVDNLRVRFPDLETDEEPDEGEDEPPATGKAAPAPEEDDDNNPW